MLLQRTAKAHEELQPGQRLLPLRQRSVLLMASGRTLAQLQQLLGDEHAALARELIAQGYLQTAPASQATQAPEPAVATDTAGRQVLNLPGTRMYLFDLCERMFANRHEAVARSLRTQLREARDLTTLRNAGLALLNAVQQHAGEERAAFLREQLADLLRESRETGLEMARG